MEEKDNVALSEEQIQKEERFNKMVGTLTALFPDFSIKKSGGYVYVTSNSASFIGTEISKISAVSTLFGNGGYWIKASVTDGLQVVLY